MNSVKERLTAALLASLALLATFTPQHASAAVGRTAGDATVSNAGEAQYRIPIVVPPGTRGMTPQIALEYSHRAAGSLLGAGWGIVGLSAISRCGHTWAQDSIVRAPDLSANDRLCLDGQRLRLVAGTYGQDGAEYRTEIESYARITSHGSAGTGVTHFFVEAKDGLFYDYGITNDSLIEALGSATARVWALSQIRDRDGNAIRFEYYEDPINGSYRIASIRYTSNTAQGIAAAYAIDFIYENKPPAEVDTAYFARSLTKEVTRLDHVDISYSGSLTRRYDLTYEGSLSSGGRSRVASIRECASNDGANLDCYAPTNFDWQNGSVGLGDEIVTAAAPSANSQLLLDFSGDGITDVVYLSGDTYAYMLGDASGNFGAPIDSGIYAAAGYFRSTIIDYNVDGREDLFVPLAGESGTWWVVPGTAGGLGAPFDSGVPFVGEDHRTLDLDGDGLEDLVWTDLSGNGAVRARLRLAGGGFDAPITLLDLSAETGRSIIPDDPLYQHARSRRAPDWNGDGREDFLVRILVNDEGGAQATYFQLMTAGAEQPVQLILNDIDPPFPLDVNGDGYTDLAYTYFDEWYYMINIGGGFDNPIPLGSSSQHDRSSPMVIDWDADGNEELLVRGVASGTWHLIRSNGEALQPAADTGLPVGPARGMAADVNGDGMTDLLYQSGGLVRTRMRTGVVPDLLDRATDGYGQFVDFDYVPLSHGTHYERYPDAVFPEQDYQGSMQVVATATASTGVASPATYLMTYRYYGARVHLQGRGFEGFYAHRSHDSRRGLWEYNYFGRTFPFTGMQTGRIVLQPDNATTISQAGNELTAPTLGSGTDLRYVPHVEGSSASEFEAGGTQNGQLIRTTTVEQSVDVATGTIYDRTTTTVEAASGNGASPGATFVERLHQPLEHLTTDPSCLGRAGRIELTNSHNQYGGSEATRTMTVTWDVGKCRPTVTIREPGDALLQVVTSLGYDGFGNVDSETVTGVGMPARPTLISWGQNGQFPVSVVNALQQATTLEWNRRIGAPAVIRDANNLATSFDYDPFGRRERETRPDQTATTWTYNDCAIVGCEGSDNHLVVIANELDAGAGLITDRRTYLDSLDRPIVFGTRTLDGAYNRIDRRYDELGRLARTSEPCWWASCTQYWTRYTYDYLDRLTNVAAPISETNTNERTTHVSYAGLTTVTYDALSKQSIQTVNALGALSRSGDHDGYYQQFDYDGFGNVVRVTDALGNTLQSNTFDIAGNRRIHTDMDAGTWLFEPNALGELESQTDAKGQVTSFGYDLLGRLTSRGEAEGTSYFTFGSSPIDHNIDRLVSIAGPGHAETFVYDGAGRLHNRTISSEGNHQIDYTYNALGMLDTLTYPTSTGGYRLKLQYDYQYGNLLRVSDHNAPATVFWQANATDPSGRFTDEVLSNGVHTIRGFDQANGNLDYIQSNSGTSVQNFRYGWDVVGNLVQREDVRQGLIENFNYDNLHRLTNSTGVDPFTVTYDAMGNIASKSNVGTYTYHPTRKHAVTSAGSSNSYTYDANGNVETRNGQLVTWYSFNLPNTINGSAGNSSQFFYAPDRSRWKQIASYGGTNETTVYIGGLIEKVTLGSATSWKHYIEGGSGEIAVYTRKEDGTSEINCLTHDHADSVDSITDQDGDIGTRLAYGAFGQRREANGQSGNPAACTWAKVTSTTRHGFTGHEMLDNLNLVHMNGRVYDQIIGRFLSPDPFIDEVDNTQGWNRYSYVHNNPLSFIDPTGYLKQGTAADLMPAIDQDRIEITRPFSHSGLSGPELFGTAQPCYQKCQGKVGQYSFGTVVRGPVKSAAIETSMRPDTSKRSSLMQWVRTGASVTIGFVPVLGAIQSAVELFSGKDYVAGEKTSRAWAAAGIVAGLFGAKGLLKAGEKLFRHSDDIVAATKGALKCCFVAGTLVMTDQGLRPIEEIAVGDLVLSRREETGETAYKPVVELIRRHDREIWELTLEVVGADGEITTAKFETTDDHPWRGAHGEWVQTAELVVGMPILRVGGDPARIQSVLKTGRTALTYNLEIADFHTYFVGDAQVWVHNVCWLDTLKEYVDDLHHIFPQAKEFADFFRNIDIHKWTVKIDRGDHRELHLEWNKRWREFAQRNPEATVKEIFEFGADLIDEFGLPIKFERYR